MKANLAELRAIVKAATIKFDPTYRAGAVAHLLGPTRHLDERFTSFMRGLSKNHDEPHA